MYTEAPTQKTCFHCGEVCNEEGVRLDNKSFCCTGCKTVYEILDQNGLNNYYCLETKPGTSLKTNRPKKRFDYLEDPAVTDRIIDFRNNDFCSVSFHIPGIHCTSCVWLLENLFQINDGITKSSVNFLKRELTISFNEAKTNLRKIVELLTSIGYEPELKLEKLDKKTSSLDRRLWLKLGVAGFAFGNIMLFSFPEYLSGSTLKTQGSFFIFFGILNIVLALPVLLYSSSDYLKSAWAAIKQGGINLDVPISIGILALFTRSIYEITTATGSGYMDSFTGLVFLLLIGRLIQKKTYERLSFDRDYKSYLPISVTVLEKDGKEQTTSIDKLKKGVRLLLRNRELVPADAILLSGNSYLDYSFITGESKPVEVQQGETIYAGGRIIGPAAEMSTIKEVSNSYLTKLWNNTAFDHSSKQRNISSLADRVSPHFTLAVLGIAMIAGMFWWPIGTEMGLTVFTSVLIVACPCALALSTPFTLGSALNIFSRNGLYIKGIEVVERLANATSVVFDKTGTLTKADQAEVTFHGQLSDSDLLLVKAACQQSVHPLSQKIATSIGLAGNPSVQNFKEHVNKGITATVVGRHIAVGSASFIQEHITKSVIQKPRQDRAASVVHAAIDGEWSGWFEITNRYRDGIKALLATLKKRFKIFLLSGDNKSQQHKFGRFFRTHSLRFSQTPQQKLDFINELQKSGEKVVMIGDGLNDAGALQQSDFGIALTDDVSSFTPACDAILDGNSLNRLNIFIDFSQASISIIKLSFGLSLIYNIVGLSFAVTGQLSPLLAAILMPLSSISIMLFTTTSTYLTARKMGLDTWK
ncbi:MAG: heavy metal translocating P-type ATPase metal-binding domain-containing protein [Balneolaceae bacterium]|jgi:Cu+-exporting ATPase